MRNILFLALFLSPFAARAGILVEPWIGYNLSTSGEFNLSPMDNNRKLDYSTVALGSKLAYKMVGFEFGADIAYQSLELNTDIPDVSGKDEFKRTDVYLYAGASLPILLKGWVKYLVASSFEITKTPPGTNEVVGNKFKDPSGYALGLGYTLFPMVNLNLEFKKLKWDKYREVGQAGSPANNISASFSEILLSVSLPLSF